MSVMTDNTMGSTQPSTPEGPGSVSGAPNLPDESERLAAAPAAASQPPEEPEPRRDFLTLMGLESKWSRALGWAVLLLAIVFPFPFWW